MLSKICDVATQFVCLALRYVRCSKAEELSADEIRILFQLVSEAGFFPKAVVPGGLFGDYRNDDGDRTGDRFPINSFCLFKVVGQENEDLYFATGWLDCAFRRVVFGSRRKGETRDQLVSEIITETRRSVPLEPIRLNVKGDMLREYPPTPIHLAGLEYFVDHTRDNNSLGSCVGVHMHCNSYMDRRRSTDVHDVLVCRKCHLRAYFPKEVKTYGELREALSRISMPVDG